MLFIYLYLFIVGIVFGSFFNVVGLRVPMKESIVSPRSACPKCGHTLKAIELIPIISYLIQKGKCSRCKTAISPIYPIVEMITGLLFILAFYQLGWNSELFVAWTFLSLLIIILVSDIAYMIIPDNILIFFGVLLLFERIFLPLSPWWDSIIGAVIGFFLLLLIAIISKGGMGGGDIKLFGLIGLVLGTKLTLLAFFLSTLFGAVIGIIGIALSVFKKKEPIPFGPFIVMGTIVSYFYGNTIIAFYLQLLKL